MGPGCRRGSSRGRLGSSPAPADLGLTVDESFGGFAKCCWRAKQLGLDQDTVNDYEWRLGYLERFFGRYRLNEMTPRVSRRMR